MEPVFDLEFQTGEIDVGFDLEARAVGGLHLSADEGKRTVNLDVAKGCLEERPTESQIWLDLGRTVVEEDLFKRSDLLAVIVLKGSSNALDKEWFRSILVQVPLFFSILLCITWLERLRRASSCSFVPANRIGISR